MDQHSTITRNDELMSAPVDEEVVFLNPSSNNYVALDTIGRRIWDLLASPRTVAELTAELTTEFAGSPVTIAADVMVFLGELERDGMISVENRRPG